MVTPIEREFAINVARERAWQHLAHLDQWPIFPGGRVKRLLGVTGLAQFFAWT